MITCLSRFPLPKGAWWWHTTEPGLGSFLWCALLLPKGRLLFCPRTRQHTVLGWAFASSEDRIKVSSFSYAQSSHNCLLPNWWSRELGSSEFWRLVVLNVQPLLVKWFAHRCSVRWNPLPPSLEESSHRKWLGPSELHGTLHRPIWSFVAFPSGGILSLLTLWAQTWRGGGIAPFFPTLSALQVEIYDVLVNLTFSFLDCVHFFICCFLGPPLLS